MTGEQITRALAEKIMRWTVERVIWPGTPECRAAGVMTSIDGPDTGFRQFDPIWSDADSCAVLDKMDADGWAYQVANVKRNGKTICNFVQDGKMGSAEAETRRRAIAEAALKAVGAWEE